MPWHFLDDGGAMGETIRRFDWSDSPLGSPVDWPPALKTSAALVLGSRFPQCLAWGPELTCIYNDAFRPILGAKPEALGRPFREVWAEAWETVGPIADLAFCGKATFMEDLPLVVDRNGHPEQAWFTFCYSPVRDEAGNVVGMLDTVIETTGKKQAEEQARLLNNELAHRMKNMLAVVQSIARQTFDPDVPAAEASRRFEERLRALGNAHEILTRGSWSDAPLAEIIGGTLAAHADAGAVTIDGPTVQVGGRQALSLALAIHELATNAAKYGALSTPAGRVSIAWQAGESGSADDFLLTWQERGGPAVEPPTRKGFGTRLIERVLARDFGGKVTIRHSRAGLECELRTRMNRLA